MAHFAWIAAALLLLAVTGSDLLTLISGSSPAESQELKMARRKTREMEALAAGAPVSIDPAKIDRLLGRATPAAAASSTESSTSNASVSLPRLSGIALVVSAGGQLRYRATLEGRVVGEQEQVDGYTVRKISSEGVLLAAGGKEWLLRAPTTGMTLRQN